MLAGEAGRPHLRLFVPLLKVKLSRDMVCRKEMMLLKNSGYSHRATLP
jgi:hypothetical protein